MFVLVNVLAMLGLAAVLALLAAAAWLVVAGDRVDEMWPMGRDEDPTLDVQNHLGDSRPIR
jgi:hypothetical protein